MTTGLAIRAIAAALPLAVLVVLAGLLALLGFLTGAAGRDYACTQVNSLIRLAAVLTGTPTPRRRYQR